MLQPFPVVSKTITMIRPWLPFHRCSSGSDRERSSSCPSLLSTTFSLAQRIFFIKVPDCHLPLCRCGWGSEADQHLNHDKWEKAQIWKELPCNPEQSLLLNQTDFAFRWKEHSDPSLSVPADPSYISTVHVFWVVSQSWTFLLATQYWYSLWCVNFPSEDWTGTPRLGTLRELQSFPFYQRQTGLPYTLERCDLLEVEGKNRQIMCWKNYFTYLDGFKVKKSFLETLSLWNNISKD